MRRAAILALCAILLALSWWRSALPSHHGPAMSDTLLPATEAALAAFRHARTANAPDGRRWLELDGAGLLAAFDAPRRARLAEIGYDVERLEVIRELLGVWAAARADALTAEHTRVPRDQVEIVVQARELRDHLVRACRYHLAHVAGMSLKLDAVANDDSAHWCDATEPLPTVSTTELGTPGVLDSPC